MPAGVGPTHFGQPRPVNRGTNPANHRYETTEEEEQQHEIIEDIRSGSGRTGIG